MNLSRPTDPHQSIYNATFYILRNVKGQVQLCSDPGVSLQELSSILQSPLPACHRYEGTTELQNKENIHGYDWPKWSELYVSTILCALK